MSINLKTLYFQSQFFLWWSTKLSIVDMQILLSYKCHHLTWDSWQYNIFSVARILFLGVLPLLYYFLNPRLHTNSFAIIFIQSWRKFCHLIVSLPSTCPVQISSYYLEYSLWLNKSIPCNYSFWFSNYRMTFFQTPVNSLKWMQCIRVKTIIVKIVSFIIHIASGN